MSAPRAVPLRFGPAARQCFGWFHAPAAPVRSAAVVLCNAYGEEALNLHRTYRVLAERLAAAGYPALRFDYDGTGDSSGGDEDPDRVAAWLDSVNWAVSELQTLSGQARIVLFGVRLGATLAAAAGARHGNLAAAVLWAPFASGRLFLREFRTLRRMNTSLGESEPVQSVNGGEDAAGFYLSAGTVAALSALNLQSESAAPAPQVLLLHRDDLPEDTRLARRWAELGAAVTQLKPAGYGPMISVPHATQLPEAAFQAILDWLGERFAEAPAAVPASASPATGGWVSGPWNSTPVFEQPVHLGAGDSLFGILAAAGEAVTSPAHSAVVLLSSGANHRIGPNRLYTVFARCLAAAGYVTLRLDIAGIGDSSAKPGKPDIKLYDIDSMADVRAAVDYLKTRHGIERVTLAGICSGAYLSFRAAALDPRVDQILLINPKTFRWREGDVLDESMRRGGKSMGFYAGTLLSGATWRRALAGGVDLRSVFNAVRHKVGKRIRARLESLVARFRPALPESEKSPAQLFRNILERGADVLMVYSDQDGGIDEMELHVGRDARALRGFERFRLVYVPGADHTFTPIPTQHKLFELLAGHLARSGRTTRM